MIPKDEYLIFRMFEEEARNVWTNYDRAAEGIEKKVVFRGNADTNAVMSISLGRTNYRSTAIFNTITRKPKFITLFVTDKVRELNEYDFRKILRHEAIHIGYPRHDANFTDMVKRTNAASSEFDVDEKEELIELQIQTRKGERFKTIKSWVGEQNIPAARMFTDDYVSSLRRDGKNNVRVRTKRSTYGGF